MHRKNSLVEVYTALDENQDGTRAFIEVATEVLAKCDLLQQDMFVAFAKEWNLYKQLVAFKSDLVWKSFSKPDTESPCDQPVTVGKAVEKDL